MGGSQSKTTISSLTEAISDIAMETVQSCEVVVQQEQNIVISNSGFSWGGDRKIAQTTAITQECFSDVRREAALQNKIIDAISQSTTSSSIAVLGAFGSSQANASANLTNIVRNNVKMSNIQKTYSEIKQAQTITYNNSGISIADKLDISQGAQAFAAATIKEVEKAGIFNTIEEHIDQTAAAKQENPLDFIAKAIGAVGDVVTSVAFLWIFFIAAVVIGGVMLFRAMGSGGDSEPNENIPPEMLPENMPQAVQPVGQPPGQLEGLSQPGNAEQPTLQYAPPPYAPQYAPPPPQYAPPQYRTRQSSSGPSLMGAITGAQIGAKVPGPPQMKAAAAGAGFLAGLRGSRT